MFLYILAGLIALIALVLLIPLSLSVTLDEAGNIRLCGRILGIPVYRSPKGLRPVRLSDYTPRAIQRRERAAKRKQQRQMRRAQRNAKRKSHHPVSGSQRPGNDMPLIDKISFIKELACVILKRTLGHARVDVERLAITVATPDAAQTAILYGGVCTALAALTEMLDLHSHLRIRDTEQYGVAADFTSDNTRADIRLHFRLRVCHLFDIALHALIQFVRRAFRLK